MMHYSISSRFRHWWVPAERGAQFLLTEQVEGLLFRRPAVAAAVLSLMIDNFKETL